MYEFIILGLIPGTNTQLSFGFWLAVAGALLGLAGIWKLHRAHIVRNAIISVSILLLTTRRQPQA